MNGCFPDPINWDSECCQYKKSLDDGIGIIDLTQTFWTKSPGNNRVGNEWKSNLAYCQEYLREKFISNVPDQL